MGQPRLFLDSGQWIFHFHQRPDHFNDFFISEHALLDEKMFALRPTSEELEVQPSIFRRQLADCYIVFSI